MQGFAFVTYSQIAVLLSDGQQPVTYSQIAVLLSDGQQAVTYSQIAVLLSDGQQAVTYSQIAVLLSDGQQAVHIDLHSVIQHVIMHDIAGQEAGHSVRWLCCCPACLNNSISGYACNIYCFQQHVKRSGYQE